MFPRFHIGESLIPSWQRGNCVPSACGRSLSRAASCRSWARNSSWATRLLPTKYFRRRTCPRLSAGPFPCRTGPLRPPPARSRRLLRRGGLAKRPGCNPPPSRKMASRSIAPTREKQKKFRPGGCSMPADVMPPRASIAPGENRPRSHQKDRHLCRTTKASCGILLRRRATSPSSAWTLAGAG